MCYPPLFAHQLRESRRNLKRVDQFPEAANTFHDDFGFARDGSFLPKWACHPLKVHFTLPMFTPLLKYPLTMISLTLAGCTQVPTWPYTRRRNAWTSQLVGETKELISSPMHATQDWEPRSWVAWEGHGPQTPKDPAIGYTRSKPVERLE